MPEIPGVGCEDDVAGCAEDLCPQDGAGMEGMQWQSTTEQGPHSAQWCSDSVPLDDLLPESAVQVDTLFPDAVPAFTLTEKQGRPRPWIPAVPLRNIRGTPALCMHDS